MILDEQVKAAINAVNQADHERTVRRIEAEMIRKLLRQANSYREAMELLDKHINAL